MQGECLRDVVIHLFFFFPQKKEEYVVARQLMPSCNPRSLGFVSRRRIASKVHTHHGRAIGFFVRCQFSLTAGSQEFLFVKARATLESSDNKVLVNLKRAETEFKAGPSVQTERSLDFPCVPDCACPFPPVVSVRDGPGRMFCTRETRESVSMVSEGLYQGKGGGADLCNANTRGSSSSLASCMYVSVHKIICDWVPYRSFV